MDTTQTILLQWSAFQTNCSSSFRNVRFSQEFSDVTLACDDHEDIIEAHRIILTAGSSFFQRILTEKRTSHPHPMIYLAGVSRTNLEAILDFLYHGQTRVPQDQLMDFLQTAQSLGVRGLNEKGEKKTLEEARDAPKDPEKYGRVKTEDSLDSEAETCISNSDNAYMLESLILPDKIENEKGTHSIIYKEMLNIIDNKPALKHDPAKKRYSRSSYWKYFEKSGLKAVCSLGGCKNPTVSLGRQGTKTGTNPLKNHLQRNHIEAWNTHTKDRMGREAMEEQKCQEDIVCLELEIASLEEDNIVQMFQEDRTNGRQNFIALEDENNMALENKAEISQGGQEDLSLGGLMQMNLEGQNDLVKLSRKPGGRAGYWKYFERRGMKADCQLGGCKRPVVSRGKEGTRGGTFALTRHLMRNHAGTWAEYLQQKQTTDVTLAFDGDTIV